MLGLVRCRLEIYIKVTKQLMEMIRQGKRINRSVNIGPLYQVNDTWVEHI